MGSSSKTIIIVGGSFAGIKAAWELAHKLDSRHKIILISNKPKTIFRASFPRVLFEDVSLESLTLDLPKNFQNTGITFVNEELTTIHQEQNRIKTNKSTRSYDNLILATGARYAYETLPGSFEFAKPICDPARILETREAINNFTSGEFFAGVGGEYTPCDGPPIEVLMDLDHRLRKLGIRKKARLHYITDKENLLPPGGPRIWQYLEKLFRKKDIIVHLNTELVKLDKKTLYFKDGKTLPYDLAVLIPPYRGVKAVESSRLADERGFVEVDWNTMRADNSVNRNIYAVGDCASISGPKQGHLALMQATIASEHIAWRINQKGQVRAYLAEFKCVMDQGGGVGLYLYSQWMSDGDVVEIKKGKKPYFSKIAFEETFFKKRGDIGQLHHKVMK